MDGARGYYYAKLKKSVRERLISYVFTHMWNLRNLTEDDRGWEGEIRYKQTEGQTIRDS